MNSKRVVDCVEAQRPPLLQITCRYHDLRVFPTHQPPLGDTCSAQRVALHVRVELLVGLTSIPFAWVRKSLPTNSLSDSQFMNCQWFGLQNQYCFRFVENA